MMGQPQGKQLQCLRCGTAMRSALPVPEGVRHPLLREANRLFTQHLRLVMYECPSCGKLEFFRQHNK